MWWSRSHRTRRFTVCRSSCSGPRRPPPSHTTSQKTEPFGGARGTRLGRVIPSLRSWRRPCKEQHLSLTLLSEEFMTRLSFVGRSAGRKLPSIVASALFPLLLAVGCGGEDPPASTTCDP